MFGRLFGRRRKNENSAAFRREMAKKLDGRHIKYVTERTDSDDFVIGRDGALIVKDDCLLVYSSANVVFRGRIDELRMSELLSLEGVIIEGNDIEHDGRHRKVIAYYTYYLKSTD